MKVDDVLVFAALASFGPTELIVHRAAQIAVHQLQRSSGTMWRARRKRLAVRLAEQTARTMVDVGRLPASWVCLTPSNMCLSNAVFMADGLRWPMRACSCLPVQRSTAARCDAERRDAITLVCGADAVMEKRLSCAFAPVRSACCCDYAQCTPAL